MLMISSLVLLAAAEQTTKTSSKIGQLAAFIKSIKQSIKSLESITEYVTFSTSSEHLCLEQLDQAKALLDKAITSKVRLEALEDAPFIERWLSRVSDAMPERVPDFSCITDWSDTLAEMMENKNKDVRFDADDLDGIFMRCGEEQCPAALNLFISRRAVQDALSNLHLAKGVDASRVAKRELQLAESAYSKAKQDFQVELLSKQSLKERYDAVRNLMKGHSSLVESAYVNTRGKEYIFPFPYAEAAQQWYIKYDALRKKIVQINDDATRQLPQNLKLLEEFERLVADPVAFITGPLTPDQALLWYPQSHEVPSPETREAVHDLISRALEVEKMMIDIQAGTGGRVDSYRSFSAALSRLQQISQDPNVSNIRLREELILVAYMCPAFSFSDMKELLQKAQPAELVKRLREKHNV